jgi:hypothetical protein
VSGSRQKNRTQRSGKNLFSREDIYMSILYTVFHRKKEYVRAAIP